jgi:hypothetical protein
MLKQTYGIVQETEAAVNTRASQYGLKLRNHLQGGFVQDGKSELLSSLYNG